MIGKPEFSVQAKEEALSFDNISVTGDQIEFASKEDGATLVTAHRYIPDFMSTTWTLAVPQVLLQKNETSRASWTTRSLIPRSPSRSCWRKSIRLRRRSHRAMPPAPS